MKLESPHEAGGGKPPACEVDVLPNYFFIIFFIRPVSW